MTVEYATRRARLRESLPDDLEALLVTDLVNVRYLSGFTGSNAALLVRRTGSSLIATDGRYVTQVAAEVPDLECVEARGVGPTLVARAGAEGISRLGIEASEVTVSARDALLAASPDTLRLVPTSALVQRLRVVKDPSELDALNRACEITDIAFSAMLPLLRPGVGERDIAWALLSAMHAAGAEGASFDSIVAFGPNSAIPHHQPTTRELESGDLVTMDFGALVDGYHADMTRTVVCGRAADWQRDLHAAVLGIQQAASGRVTPGALPRELDEQVRSAIEGSGFAVAHGLGHGVGLQIHEDPFLTPGSGAEPLAVDVAVTVEPGIYLPGRGGVRVEDTVVVLEAGARALTRSDRALLEC